MTEANEVLITGILILAFVYLSFAVGIQIASLIIGIRRNKKMDSFIGNVIKSDGICNRCGNKFKIMRDEHEPA